LHVKVAAQSAGVFFGDLSLSTENHGTQGEGLSENAGELRFAQAVIVDQLMEELNRIEHEAGGFLGQIVIGDQVEQFKVSSLVFGQAAAKFFNFFDGSLNIVVVFPRADHSGRSDLAEVLVVGGELGRHYLSSVDYDYGRVGNVGF